MKKVAVLFGGPGNEYEVSLESMASLIEHFPSDEFELYPLGIDKELSWYYGHYEAADVISDSWKEKGELVSLERRGRLLRANNKVLDIDIFFSLIHGSYGEDGKLQAYLQLNDCLYVGSDYISSALGFDKELTHRLLEASGIKMADYLCLTAKQSYSYERVKAEIGQPFIVKPAREGSSYGISVVNSQEEYQGALELAFQYDSKLVVERYIEGREIGCAVIESGNHYLLGACDEIECHKDFFDYQAKYSFEDTVIHCPARITRNIEDKIKHQALEVFQRLDCRGYARLDFFLSEDSNIFFNEINTVPGFTSHSRFPMMMQMAGYSFQEVIRLILRQAESYHG